MEQGKEVMTLICGSEEIVIETNDLYSEDNEMTDTSSCSSDSEYEEIEVEPPFHDEKQYQKIEIEPTFDIEKQSEAIYLPNPYVKLVRCDHLVKSVFPENRIEHRNSRSSARMRRPNSTYLTDEFLVGKYAQKAPDKQLSFVKVKKKKKLKNINKNIFEKVKKKKKLKNIYKNDIHNPGRSMIQVGITNFGADLAENIKQEYPSGCQVYAYDVSDMDKMNPCYRFFSSDIVTEPLVSTIKEEPPDDYFDGMIGNSFNCTSDCETVKPVKLSKINFDSIVKKETDETDYGSMSSEYSHLNDTKSINYNSVFNGELNETDTKIIKVEKTEESSDSEVDIERDWDGPVFIVDPETVAFDHPYSSRPENTDAPPVIVIYPHNSKKTDTNPSQSQIGKQKQPLKNLKERKNIKDLSIKSLKKSEKELSIFKETAAGRNMETHCIRERQSRALLKDDFRRLRDMIPQLNGNERTPKVSILTSAYLYIKSLEISEKTLQKSIENLKEKQNNLKKILKLLTSPGKMKREPE
ncbi:uncharacterized protein LOC132721635 [Ruditapes philippinarum]|uniref:uncharacterized protein LOC132721635 n=1 Tax=Ruditapes philippinarum TaxID=129788 RepID=UPI00295B4A52|nr:uncharacterized protein LOC132721635 [Ruditapes philippinarum]XP_060561946.1 uncharacterized protein LOC132721635 [Ruditapes philippinarum]XP_060561947.1 uncharacterized protein LOC132721635 [Ruditapes philippinarum]